MSWRRPRGPGDTLGWSHIALSHVVAAVRSWDTGLCPDLEPFLVRMELQSIIRYVASLERDDVEWCAYHFPFMPEDVDRATRPHLLRLSQV